MPQSCASLHFHIVFSTKQGGATQNQPRDWGHWIIFVPTSQMAF